MMSERGIGGSRGISFFFILVALGVTAFFAYLIINNRNKTTSTVNVLVNPVIVKNNEVTEHLFGGGNFVLTLTDDIPSEHQIPLNITAYQGDYVEYRFVINNVGETNVLYNVSLNDFNNDNFFVKITYENYFQTDFIEDVSSIILPNEEKYVSVIFGVINPFNDAFCSGTLSLSLEIVWLWRL